MENKRKALGKGLEQLFSNERIDFENFEQEIVKETEQKDVLEINISEIRSNPHQPRKNFNDESLKELAASIKEHGVIQPIIVKKSIKGYELVAGERRTKATQLAGFDKIPAIIKEFTDQEMMEIALVENIQREDLNPIEEANAYQKILETENYTQEILSKKFGKSRSYITNILGIIRLPEEVKNIIAEKKLLMGHAKVLSKLEDHNIIIELANLAVSKGLSVRDLEDLTKTEKKDKPIKKQQSQTSQINKIYEKVLGERVGTQVKVHSKKIEIPYNGERDLERILEILGIEIEGE